MRDSSLFPFVLIIKQLPWGQIGTLLPSAVLNEQPRFVLDSLLNFDSYACSDSWKALLDLQQKTPRLRRLAVHMSSRVDIFNPSDNASHYLPFVALKSSPITRLHLGAEGLIHMVDVLRQAPHVENLSLRTYFEEQEIELVGEFVFHNLSRLSLSGHRDSVVYRSIVASALPNLRRLQIGIHILNVEHSLLNSGENNITHLSLEGCRLERNMRKCAPSCPQVDAAIQAARACQSLRHLQLWAIPEHALREMISGLSTPLRSLVVASIMEGPAIRQTGTAVLALLDEDHHSLQRLRDLCIAGHTDELKFTCALQRIRLLPLFASWMQDEFWDRLDGGRKPINQPV